MDDVAGVEESPGESRSRRNLTYIVGAVALALAAAAIVLVIGGLGGADETDLVFDRRTGEFHFEEPVFPDSELRSRVLAVDAESGEVLWKTDVPGFARNMNFDSEGLVMANAGQLRGTPGIVSVGIDGRPRWQVSLNTDGWGTLAYESTALDDGDLLIATRVSPASEEPARMVRVDATTGEAIWNTELDLPAIEVEVVDGVVIALQSGVGFAGVDAASGEVLWETAFEAPKWTRPIARPVEPPDRVDDGIAYFELSDQDRGGIVGIDAAGNIELEIEVPWQTAILRVDRGAIFTMQNPKTVSRYSTATGERVWTRNGVTTSTAFETFGDIALIKGGAARRILGINLDSGDVIWRRDSDRNRLFTSADLRHFYVWNEDEARNTLHAIDPRSGEEEWSYVQGGLMRQTAVVHGEIVYAATRDQAASGLSSRGRAGGFAALDATTGGELWTLDLELGFEEMKLGPGGDVLYILTTHN